MRGGVWARGGCQDSSALRGVGAYSAMPTNPYIFAVRYQWLVMPVALGTLLAAATLPVVVAIVAGAT